MSFSAFTPRQGTVHLLPEEVLDRIISLAAPRIKDASQVSWTWRSVAVRHMFCTMTVPHRNFAHFLDFISQPQHSYIATHIKELSLQILDGKSLRVRTDANARRTLETLETQLLKSMLERLPRLDHLTVKNLLIYTSPPPTAGQFNLKSLELNLVAPAAAVTDDGIIGMLALFSRIDYLKIFDIQRESAWAKLAARLGATGAVMQGIPGPSVSELEIQLKIGISLFPYLLPLLPGSSTTLRYLALECRTLGDVSGLGYFLSEVGPNITSFYLDLWGLEMVDEDDHDKYIIEPPSVLQALQVGLGSCTNIRYFRLRCGAVFPTENDPRNGDVFAMFVELINLLPKESLSHLVIDLNDTKCLRNCEGADHEALINPWLCGTVDWRALRAAFRRFKCIRVIELLAEADWMDQWVEQESREYVLEKMLDFEREGLLCQSQTPCESRSGCVHGQ